VGVPVGIASEEGSGSMTKQLALFGAAVRPVVAAPKTRPIRYTEDPNPRAPRPFIGVPVECAEPRRCSVCGNVLEVGRLMIVFENMAAHVGCGRTKPSRRF